MRIVIAPNAFKNCLTAVDAAKIIAEGIRQTLPKAELLLTPVSDGGDGLVDIAIHSLSGKKQICSVRDPFGRQVKAAFCYISNKKLAIIEMARASGLALLSQQEYNPMLSSTFGTGELISAAMGIGAKKILVGLGGSATCDAGMGMANSLGIRFLDEKNRELIPNGKNLFNIRNIDISKIDIRIATTDFEALCDVNNPLIGEKGAARIFASQKGANLEEVEYLEKGIINFSDCVNTLLCKKIHNLQGGGAAGGLGAGLYAFLNASIRSGQEEIFKLLEMSKKLRSADLVITGEGCLDKQTLFGKAPAGVAALAKKMGIPCIAVAGSIRGNIHHYKNAGFSSIFSLSNDNISTRQAIDNAEKLLKDTAKDAINAFISGKLD
ncbi:MAG: glycerate kinase [Candidatus Theseobacter exili]|nr:glycerate kinase [Candidatus Theseobacter exili]